MGRLTNMPTPTTEKLIEEKVMDARIELPKFMRLEEDKEHGTTAIFNTKGAADFLRNAFEEVRASEREEVKGLLEGMKKENSDFPSLEAAKDYGKLDDLADYAHIDGQNYALDEAIAKL